MKGSRCGIRELLSAEFLGTRGKERSDPATWKPAATPMPRSPTGQAGGLHCPPTHPAERRQPPPLIRSRVPAPTQVDTRALTQARTPPAGRIELFQFYTRFYFIMGKVETPPFPQQQPVKFIPKITQYKTGLFQN